MTNIQALRTEFRRTVAGLRERVGERGLVRTGGRVAAVVAAQVAYPVIRTRRRADRFGFLGAALPYAFARYNNSFLNERTVEIAIAEHFLAAAPPGRMLEVGNVLSHYGHSGHTVVDKYETACGVRNVDIVDFKPELPYDTVVAISTLEHVGWDEQPRDPWKVFRALDVTRGCVAAGGRLLLTIPIGYNSVLDEGLAEGRVAFPREAWLVRTNRRNEWVETDRDEALAREYGAPYTAANGLYVGMIG